MVGVKKGVVVVGEYDGSGMSVGGQAAVSWRLAVVTLVWHNRTPILLIP